MIESWLIWTICAAAFLSAAMFGVNLLFYRRLPHVSLPESRLRPSVSVLIPARNEENHIEEALQSVLANRGVNLEVLVLDDHSVDRTAEIVRRVARQDGRVTLLAGQALPEDWCGKQFACWQLAGQARHEWLLFLDSDVRLAPDALARMIHFGKHRGLDLGSGVPRQETQSFLERLLLPLIHFVLLGFLPMPMMRWTRLPAFSAGCGQLFLARRSAYQEAGGHATIRRSWHDGLTLPRAFRQKGCRTDLFDATDVARCRMYDGNRSTWRGLQKNAVEGLASPGAIGPMTFLLLTGHVLPFLAAGMWFTLSSWTHGWLGAAVVCAWIPRWIAAWKFKQSLLGAALHPLGILLLLANQWSARILAWTGNPQRWRGRLAPVLAQGNNSNQPRHRLPSIARRCLAPFGILLLVWMLFLMMHSGWSKEDQEEPSSSRSIASFTLQDQYDHPHVIRFPSTNLVVLTIADREGSRQLQPWLHRLKTISETPLTIHGLVPLGSVPGFWKNRLIDKFRDQWSHPVLLDWGRRVTEEVGYVPDEANVVVVQTNGTICARFHGQANSAKLERLEQILRSAGNKN